MVNLEKTVNHFDHLRIEVSKLNYSIDNSLRLRDLLEQVKDLLLNTFDDGELERYFRKCDEIEGILVVGALNPFLNSKRLLINLLDIIIASLQIRENTAIREADSLHYPEMMYVKPLWKGRNFDLENDLCFLLMPFSQKWSDQVWRTIDEIVTNCGLKCERADQHDGRVIMDDIWKGICRARVIIADLTAKNPNVTYEVGLADVLGKDVILLSQSTASRKIPFDFLGQRLLVYNTTEEGRKNLAVDLEKKLKKFTQIQGSSE
jgi:hypothetical protein